MPEPLSPVEYFLVAILSGTNFDDVLPAPSKIWEALQGVAKERTCPTLNALLEPGAFDAALDVLTVNGALEFAERGPLHLGGEDRYRFNKQPFAQLLRVAMGQLSRGESPIVWLAAKAVDQLSV